MSGLKDALRGDLPVLGLLVTSPNAQIVELCGWLGFDFVHIDMEHGDGLDAAAVLPLIRAADAAGTGVLVRTPALDTGLVKSLLDWGADGICVPHVRTRAEAETAVRATKYAPAGVRGMDPFVRSARHLTGESWAEHWPRANDETVVLLIVEDGEGLENLEAIAAVPGVDMLWIGHGDLSQSLGVAIAGPEIAAAKARGLQAAKRHGIAMYAPLNSSASVDRENRARQYREQIRAGYRVFVGHDATILKSGLKELLLTTRHEPSP